MNDVTGLTAAFTCICCESTSDCYHVTTTYPIICCSHIEWEIIYQSARKSSSCQSFPLVKHFGISFMYLVYPSML